MVNQVFFTGAPIIPPRLQGLDNARQVTPNTTTTAKAIGKALDVSPLKVEAFVRGATGQVGEQALGLSDRGLAALGVIDEVDVGGQGVIEGITARFGSASGNKQLTKFFDTYGEAIKKFNSYKVLVESEPEAVVDEYLKNNDRMALLGKNMENQRKVLSVMFSMIRRLENEKGEEALQEISEIRDEIMSLAAEFNAEAEEFLAQE